MIYAIRVYGRDGHQSEEPDILVAYSEDTGHQLCEWLDGIRSSSFPRENTNIFTILKVKRYL